MHDVDVKGVLEKVGAPADLRQECLAFIQESQASGARIKQMRERLGFPQKAFAELLGLSRRGLQDVEAQKNVPSGQTLASLMGLGVSSNWVLAGRGPEFLATSVGASSQVLIPPALTVAFGLVAEALGPMRATAAQHQELVTLVAEMLVEGLPEAQVLTFARRTVSLMKGGEVDDRAAPGGTTQAGPG